MIEEGPEIHSQRSSNRPQPKDFTIKRNPTKAELIRNNMELLARVQRLQSGKGLSVTQQITHRSVAVTANRNTVEKEQIK